MTPYEITLFLRIAFTQEQLKEVPILKDTLDKFVRTGLIEISHASNSGYKIAFKGEVYMSLIQSILPENIHTK